MTPVAKKGAQKSATRTTVKEKASKGLSAEENAALKDTIRERKAEARGADGESAAIAAVAAMAGADRAMAGRIHAIVKTSAPSLSAKTWYGMPAYANKDGKVVCFFKSAQKFKSKYATLGFEEGANLDEDAMWPTSFALKALTSAEEARIAALVKKAAR